MTKKKKADKAKTPKLPAQKHGKKFREAQSKITPDKLHTLAEAITILKSLPQPKFDATVEIHARLGIDPVKADQQLRGTVALPHGTGKTTRVIVFCDDTLVKDCKSAGAVEAGNEDLIAKITKGWLGFDTAVATPDMMKNLGKIAKTLGTKGLMPNPKTGTVTPDPVKAVKELMAGRIEFKNDEFGIIHTHAGKISFDDTKLLENIQTIFKTLADARPSSVKKIYVQSLTLTSTMSPGIKLDPKEIK